MSSPASPAVVGVGDSSPPVPPGVEGTPSRAPPPLSLPPPTSGGGGGALPPSSSSGTPGPALPQHAQSRESLLVRVDQPVEGVEFQPHTLLRGHDGGVVSTNTSSTTQGGRRLEYSWLRSRARRTCEEPSCGHQREAALLQDLVTGRRYCSPRCLAMGFRESRSRLQPQAVKKAELAERWASPSEAVAQGLMMPPLEYDEADHQVWNVKPFQEDTEWEEVGKERNYIPTSRDVGHVLKLVVRAVDGKTTTLQTTSEETPVVIGPPPPPPKRRVIPAPHVMMSPQFSDATALQFRAVTYNILADIYATQNIFPYCPRWALSWKYRRMQVLRELEQYDADVICLQEVQQDHFQQFLMPALARMGYEAVYKSKTREAMGTTGKIDGCATLFRREKFTLLETHEIEFNKVAVQMAQQGAFASNTASTSGPNAPPNDPASVRCLKRLCKDNVAHVLVLEGMGLNGEVEHICIANVHVFWDPEFPDVKLWQTHVLLQELEGITGRLPLLLCGDFNSTPDSSVVELLAQESVDPKHPDLAYDKLGLLPPPGQISHSLSLVSAHAMVTGSEPTVTNLTAHYKGCLDYIWLNESLAAVACLEMPTEEDLRQIDDTPLPNSVYPSDHVALVVDVRMASRAPGVQGVQNVQGGAY